MPPQRDYTLLAIISQITLNNYVRPLHTNMELMTGRIDLNTESIGRQNDLLNTVIGGQHQAKKDLLSFLHSIENYMNTLETLQSDNKDKIAKDYQTLSELAQSICNQLYESTNMQAKELNVVIEQYKEGLKASRAEAIDSIQQAGNSATVILNSAQAEIL